MSDEEPARQTAQRCSVAGCGRLPAHQLVSGAWPDRFVSWLCREHWLAGAVRVVVSEEQA